jgi:hypothetical protein
MTFIEAADFLPLITQTSRKLPGNPVGRSSDSGRGIANIVLYLSSVVTPIAKRTMNVHLKCSIEME